MVVVFARHSDTETMYQLLREGYSPDLLTYMPLGCQGFKHYLHDLIGLKDQHPDRVFTVLSGNDSSVYGVAEIRFNSNGLFLNNIHIERSQRGKGLGTKLLHHTLEMTRRPGDLDLSLDVFQDNESAKQWYLNLGFLSVEEYIWATFTPGTGLPEGEFCCPNMPQANCVQNRYGFSQFTLQTQNISYDIGRLGGGFFVLTDPGILRDEIAQSALRTLDPARQCLIRCRMKHLKTHAHKVKTIAVSHRMTAKLNTVLERLSLYSGVVRQ